LECSRIDELRELERKSGELSIDPERCFYLLASKSGFSTRLRAEQSARVHLWDLSTITGLIHELA